MKATISLLYPRASGWPRLIQLIGLKIGAEASLGGKKKKKKKQFCLWSAASACTGAFQVALWVSTFVRRATSLTWERKSTYFLHFSPSQEEAEREPSLEPSCAGTLMSYFPALRTERNKGLLFQLLLYDILRGQPELTKPVGHRFCPDTQEFPSFLSSLRHPYLVICSVTHSVGFQ